MISLVMHKFIILTGLSALLLTPCKSEKLTESEKWNVSSPAPEIAESIVKKTSDPIEMLSTHLSLIPSNQINLSEQKFAKTPLTENQAEKATQMILASRLATLRVQRKQEFEEKVVKHGSKTMRYEFKTYGDVPKGGHSLYISMHGGGGAPARVNDQQWGNQIKLYRPKEGIYVAPRAPTNTWNLWHQSHIDPMFDQLIADFITFKQINPNRVYIMGYSAGGDGTYQLAPRMADRWAGAAMMAGHPGDAKTWNLRNLAFIIQCGGKDHAYDRAKLCAKWGKKLDQLAKQDPGGYSHKAIIYPKYGHWMNLECKQAVPWMAKHTRNPWPKKLHWYQDNVTQTRFHWLSNRQAKPKQLITAEVRENTITLNNPAAAIEHSSSKRVGDFTPIGVITLRLSDKLLDLNKVIIVKNNLGKVMLEKKVQRNILSIYESILTRPDHTSVSTATVTIKF